jgi:hypothetical protein
MTAAVESAAVTLKTTPSKAVQSAVAVGARGVARLYAAERAVLAPAFPLAALVLALPVALALGCAARCWRLAAARLKALSSSPLDLSTAPFVTRSSRISQLGTAQA